MGWSDLLSTKLTIQAYLPGGKSSVIFANGIDNSPELEAGNVNVPMSFQVSLLASLICKERAQVTE